MRLFFALPLPGEAKDRLRAPLEAAKKAGGDGVSFTRIEQLHFTLAFLGEQPGPDEALAAGEALREGAPFEVALSGTGAFPNTARPRVLWLGVKDGAAPLIEAAERDRKSTRLNSSHSQISYAVFCLKKKKKKDNQTRHAVHGCILSRQR